MGVYDGSPRTEGIQCKVERLVVTPLQNFPLHCAAKWRPWKKDQPRQGSQVGRPTIPLPILAIDTLQKVLDIATKDGFLIPPTRTTCQATALSLSELC
jgi:hypothetical protein